jgi:hypothetical protein
MELLILSAQQSRPGLSCPSAISGFLRGALVLGSMCCVNATSSGQQMIWDHIGDGFREVYPGAFDQLGDLDGDGVRDFIYGMTWNKLVVIRSGSDGSEIWSHFYPTENSHQTGFGGAVANLGLFDADGVEDYAVGATGYSPAGQAEWAGLVRVFSGATHQPILDIFENNGNEFLGRQVVGLGDVNGDGFVDFGVSDGGAGTFRVYLGPNGTLLREHPEASTYGEANGPIGDFDGDGCDDYLIGQFCCHESTIWGAGRVLLYSGRSGALLLTMEGTRSRRQAGLSVSRGGDWNGDGIEDIVAGAPGTGILQGGHERSGVYVFSGADGSELHFFDGEDYCLLDSGFGWTVSSGKDVNGDGVPDLLVGAPLEPYATGGPGVSGRGSAFLFSGATRGLLWEYTGEQMGQAAGGRVKLIDDHNGDGLADWMVLSPTFDSTPSVPQGPEGGRLSVFAGAFGDIDPACSGGPNSVGAGALLWNSGPISVRENALELVVSEMPKSTPALLIHGQALAPGLPFGAGELCLPAPLAVLAVVTTGSGGPPGASNHAKVLVDLEGPPFTNGGNQVRPGDTWAFQFLYRDQGQRNTSNALRAVFVP